MKVMGGGGAMGWAFVVPRRAGGATEEELEQALELRMRSARRMANDWTTPADMSVQLCQLIAVTLLGGVRGDGWEGLAATVSAVAPGVAEEAASAMAGREAFRWVSEVVVRDRLLGLRLAVAAYAWTLERHARARAGGWEELGPPGELMEKAVNEWTAVEFLPPAAAGVIATALAREARTYALKKAAGRHLPTTSWEVREDWDWWAWGVWLRRVARTDGETAMRIAAEAAVKTVAAKGWGN